MKVLEWMVIRNPFPWTCHYGQTTCLWIFSEFSVTVSEITAEMRGNGVVEGDDVSKPEVRRRGHRHTGEPVTAVRLIGVTGWKINGLVWLVQGRAKGVESR